MSHRTPIVSIRAATAADGPALVRLAALDSADVPFGDVLLAEQDGRLVAALQLADGRAIADPFERTAHLVDLLRRHAQSVAGPVPAARHRRLPALRRAPLAA